MMKHNPENERIKRKYLIFLKEAKRQDESSLDAVAMALSRFEKYTKFRNFKAFHFEQAVGFKRHLAKQLNKKTGHFLSKATQNSTLRYLKGFFQWIAMQAGYKSRINYTDSEYFNLSEKGTRIATARRIKPVPTMEQIKHVIEHMPNSSVIERRNRALVAFTLLTGARDSATASLKLKHVDITSNSIYQDAREVKTKFSKSFTTYFFPVGEEIRQVVAEWVSYLKDELLYGNDDPLFPKTRVIRGENLTFEPSGVQNNHWATASPIREIFKASFNNAGLVYFNPQSFRNTLVRLGEKICSCPEDFKAWSQNLGHEGVLTTFNSYGEVQPQRQAEIIQQLNSPRGKDDFDKDEIIKALSRQINAINQESTNGY